MRQRLGSFGPVALRVRALSSRLGPVVRRASTVVGRPFAIVGCFCAIGRGPMAIPLGPQKHILSTRRGVILQIVQTGQRIASRTAPIAKLGLSIAILRCLIAIPPPFLAV